jgi:hypothetical protein
MDIQVFNAFRKAGLSDDQAQAIVEAVNKSIDERYRLHADKIATKGDLKELESSLVKWIVGTLIASVAVMTGLMALLLKAVGH